MNDIEALTKLHMAARAQYEQQVQQFSKLVKQEAALRRELTRLSDLDQSAAAQGASLSSMQHLGADLIWQGWLGRAKTALNMDLAQVLARKEHEKTIVRRAFGKVTALEHLIDEARKKRRKDRAAAELNSILEQAILKQDQ